MKPWGRKMSKRRQIKISERKIDAAIDPKFNEAVSTERLVFERNRFGVLVCIKIKPR